MRRLRKPYLTLTLQVFLKQIECQKIDIIINRWLYWPQGSECEMHHVTKNQLAKNLPKGSKILSVKQMTYPSKAPSLFGVLCNGEVIVRYENGGKIFRTSFIRK